MNGLHFMLFAGFLINLCYFNVKDDFLKVIVGLPPLPVSLSLQKNLLSLHRQTNKKAKR